MRKKTTAIVVAVATVMMLFPSNPTNADPTRVTYYAVWYSCIISPPCCSEPVGEWTLHCDGTMTGWGWEPGHNCTTTVTTYGSYCDGGGGGGGGGGGCGPGGCNQDP